ncbi:MAG TPA: exodeoxyribonuclease VII small subunit, partial [Sutterellaceae bacterium]|nr:exodeoxyribonuclease VII small subunit [Sutterellaceae bacterium]
KHCNDLLKRAEDRVRELDQKFGNQQDDDEPEETPVSRRSRRNDDDIPF